MSLTTEQITQLQQQLKDLGYNIKLTGNITAETIRAYSLAERKARTPFPSLLSLNYVPTIISPK